MPPRLWTPLLFSVLALMAPGFALSQNARPLDPRIVGALHVIRPEGIRAHLEFLADDALEGRHTGSRGFELAAKYMRAQFAALGLKGGAKDGGFFQPVFLRQTDVDPAISSLVILFDTHAIADGSNTAPVVFAGYGISAPQFHYDDYAGIDVKGKIVAVLTFEAPDSFPATERAYDMDSDVKREIAVAHGAVGIIGIIAPELEEQLPWNDLLREVKIGSNSLRLLDAPNHVFGLDEQIKVAAILNRSGTDALVAGEESTLKEIFDRAKAGKPGAFPFKKTVSIQYHARHTPVNSMNVVAILSGSDAALRNEYVVFTAHLDHLGIGPAVDGDNIYNGALDNAAGSSVLLEVARFFASLPSPPARSVAFVAANGRGRRAAGICGVRT